MNWKTTAAAAIVTHAAPAAAPDSQQGLCDQLAELIDGGKVAAGSVGFAQSVLGGFKKYGSWTPKQVDAVRNLIARSSGQAEPAPVEGPDAALAASLEAALPQIAARDTGFALSLLSGFKKYGSFTDRQRPHVERLVKGAEPPLMIPPMTGPNKAACAYIAPTPTLGVLCPNLCALIHLNGFARFTVGKLQLSLKNDGSVIWVKWDGRIAGSIGSENHAYRPSRRYLADYALEQCKAALLAVEADPKAAAAADGILTGRCSCCSRPLTDPVSIKLGIGPICILKF
jgi:hypothetical protein